MDQKLEHAKALMAAVVLGDWNEIDRESQALLALTRDPAWAVLISPTYDAQSDLFVTQLRELIKASQQRNLEATAKADGVLIFSCVRCHQSLKVLRDQRKSR